jgi:hypothetical protein
VKSYDDEGLGGGSYDDEGWGEGGGEGVLFGSSVQGQNIVPPFPFKSKVYYGTVLATTMRKQV